MPEEILDTFELFQIQEEPRITIDIEQNNNFIYERLKGLIYDEDHLFQQNKPSDEYY